MPTIQFRSPSNIALVKYWGKHGNQLPKNASISFTLNNAFTETTMNYEPKQDEQPWVQFTFEGKAESKFEAKVITFFETAAQLHPALKNYQYKVDSHNSFPHSTGIASSASAMSALAMCVMQCVNDIREQPFSSEILLEKASYLARLGSGSAARSVFPYAAIWGKHQGITNSNDQVAIPAEAELHPIFKNFHDDILIVSIEEKSVSSRAGHALMENNPFASVRYQEAEKNLENLMRALNQGDLDLFGKIVEEEALMLHALMMTSTPSYILMQPNTLKIIELIRNFRKETDLPLYFTLDAGPNVHLLYPNEHENPIHDFIQTALKPLCDNGKIIRDTVGSGPVKL